MQRETVQATVVKTEATSDGDYLVFAENETFTVDDSLVEGQWRSSDLYGKIQAGKTYRFKVVGYRFGPTSTYRNIIEADEEP